jgi:glutathione S-transferase
MTGILTRAASIGATLLRPTRGSMAIGHRRAPKKMLELYEAEYCPFCRYVRETLTELDLDAKIHPVPKGGSRFKAALVALGGKPKVPFLHDPNTNQKLYESEAIAEYLYAQYGPKGYEPPPRELSTSTMATALRGKSGMFAQPGKPADKPLELYSFEASPGSRLVRETLCELELPYLLHNVGKGKGVGEWLLPGMRDVLIRDYEPATVKRRKLAQRGGRMQVPYLVDPNTGTALYDSARIVAYLRKTYAATEVVVATPTPTET